MLLWLWSNRTYSWTDKTQLPSLGSCSFYLGQRQSLVLFNLPANISGLLYLSFVCTTRDPTQGLAHVRQTLSYISTSLGLLVSFISETCIWMKELLSPSSSKVTFSITTCNAWRCQYPQIAFHSKYAERDSEHGDSVVFNAVSMTMEETMALRCISMPPPQTVSNHLTRNTKVCAHVFVCLICKGPDQTKIYPRSKGHSVKLTESFHYWLKFVGWVQTVLLPNQQKWLINVLTAVPINTVLKFMI